MLNRNRKLQALVLAMGLVCVLPQVSMAGVRDGAGGDGVYVNGKIVLRDLLAGQNLDLVSDNFAFAKGVPGFKDLIDELAAVHPRLAIAVLEQLVGAKLWTTKTSLPILPASETTVTGPRAEVQIATRFGDDILISLPAFKQVEGSYVLLHEALHGIVPGDGPMHHIYVREIVRYLHDNQGRIDRAQLDDILSKAEAELPPANADFPASDTLLRVVLTGDEKDPLTCAVQSIASNAFESVDVFAADMDGASDAVSKWRDFSHCGKNALFEYLKTASPGIYRYLSLPYYASIPYVSEARKPGFFSSRDRRAEFASDCRDYGSPEMEKKLDENAVRIQSSLQTIAQAKAEIETASRSQDPKSVFIQAFSRLSLIAKPGKDLGYFLSVKDMNEYDGQLKSSEEDLKKARATYEQNVAICRK